MTKIWWTFQPSSGGCVMKKDHLMNRKMTNFEGKYDNNSLSSFKDASLKMRISLANFQLSFSNLG